MTTRPGSIPRLGTIAIGAVRTLSHSPPHWAVLLRSDRPGAAPDCRQDLVDQSAAAGLPPSADRHCAVRTWPQRGPRSPTRLRSTIPVA